ncbi:PilN domain-containing protein [Sphaerospermopsis aphanizomenoides BCCUSP55]|uniref:PilN domain-containing protein n=1 Tax=Sphaerospermopsis aphanizomenoides TaxID=459663 RepID=UPI000AB9694A|nr:PilN domain-containing protein [Sphaerospermopsis aphanizomenoides]MBK1990743.1 PilN domain-containing protein [Sphaerospermopsis aphanizomenoides BCCUSP55]
MYSLDINFLKDRAPTEISEAKPVKQPISLGELTPVFIGLGVGLFFPALTFGGLWFLNAQNDGLSKKIAQLEQEGKDLDGKIADIKKIKDETAGVKDQTQALVTVFDQIRPWSAMLQDLRDRIPANVQVENIRQIPPVIQAPNATGPKPSNPAGLLEISGYARSFSDVNDFLLSMGQSKLLNAAESGISTAELIDAPPITGAVPPEDKSGVKLKPPQVVKYTIKASLSSVPASELIRELEQKGTVGLVKRIRSLQETGAIAK